MANMRVLFGNWAVREDGLFNRPRQIFIRRADLHQGAWHSRLEGKLNRRDNNALADALNFTNLVWNIYPDHFAKEKGQTEALWNVDDHNQELARLAIETRRPKVLAEFVAFALANRDVYYVPHTYRWWVGSFKTRRDAHLGRDVWVREFLKAALPIYREGVDFSLLVSKVRWDNKFVAATIYYLKRLCHKEVTGGRVRQGV